MLGEEKKKKILNSNGLKKFLKKYFPKTLLEARSKQFFEIFTVLFIKNFLKQSCRITRHRKGKILKTCDLKTNFLINKKEAFNFSYFFKKLIKNNLT